MRACVCALMTLCDLTPLCGWFWVQQQQLTLTDEMRSSSNKHLSVHILLAAWCMFQGDPHVTRWLTLQEAGVQASLKHVLAHKNGLTIRPRGQSCRALTGWKNYVLKWCPLVVKSHSTPENRKRSLVSGLMWLTLSLALFHVCHFLISFSLVPEAVPHPFFLLSLYFTSWLIWVWDTQCVSVCFTGNVCSRCLCLGGNLSGTFPQIFKN